MTSKRRMVITGPVIIDMTDLINRKRKMRRLQKRGFLSSIIQYFRRQK